MNRNNYILFQEAFKARAISKTIGYLNKEVGKREANKFLDIIKNLYSKFNLQLDKIDDDYLDYFKKDKALSVTSSVVDNPYDIHSIKYWFSLEDGFIGSTVTKPFILRKFYPGQWVKYDKSGEEVVALVDHQSDVAEGMVKIRVDKKVYAISEDKLEPLSMEEVNARKKELKDKLRAESEAKRLEIEEKRRARLENDAGREWKYMRIDVSRDSTDLANVLRDYMKENGVNKFRFWTNSDINATDDGPDSNWSPAALYIKRQGGFYLVQNIMSGSMPDDTTGNEFIESLNDLHPRWFKWPRYIVQVDEDSQQWQEEKWGAILKTDDPKLIDAFWKRGYEFGDFEEPFDYPILPIIDGDEIDSEEGMTFDRVIKSQSEFDTIKTGMKAKARLRSSGEDFTEGVLYKGSRSRFYFIHNDNYKDGAEPDGSDWRKYGEYSWGLGRDGRDINDEFFELTILGGIDDIDIDSEFPEFDIMEEYRKFNKPHNARYEPLNSSRIWIKDNIEKQADFAVILYLDKLLNDTDLDVTSVKDKRKEQKEGALSFMKDVDIKKANLNRYADAIIDKMGLSEKEVKDALNLKGFVTKALKGELALYYVLFMRLHPVLKLNDYVYSLMNALQNDRESHARDYFQEVQAVVKNLYLRVDEKDRRKSIQDTINKWNEQYKGSERYDKGQIELVHRFNKLSKKFYEKLKKKEITSLFDLELLISDLNSLKGLKDKSQFKFQGDFSYALSEPFGGYVDAGYLAGITEKGIEINNKALDNWEKYIDMRF